MAAPFIEKSSFGALTINGRNYTWDLMIYPDGRIEGPWRRTKGHLLSFDDLERLIKSEPEIIVAGTGVNGRMKPEADVEETLASKGIRLIALPNDQAIARFNALFGKDRVAGCFHLTC